MAMKPDSLAVEFCALPLAFASSFGRHGRTVYDGWTGANARSFLQQPRRSRQGIPPKVGRWLSNDPIGISGGLNQYTAFGNNPVGFVDPEGTISGAKIFIIIGGVAWFGQFIKREVIDPIRGCLWPLLYRGKGPQSPPRMPPQDRPIPTKAQLPDRIVSGHGSGVAYV